MLSFNHDKLQTATGTIGQEVESSVPYHQYTLGLWVSAHDYTYPLATTPLPKQSASYKTQKTGGRKGKGKKT